MTLKYLTDDETDEEYHQDHENDVLNSLECNNDSAVVERHVHALEAIV